MDLLEQLLSEDGDDEIRLTNEDGTELVFNQVAVIPDGDKIFAILTPVTEIEGVSDDEAIVFRVDERDGEHVLVLEEDEPTAMDVFEKYVKLWEESRDGSGEDFDDEDPDDGDEGKDN
ncbi:MAG: DUF1292 domain-containing protein [Candidatus Coproplasma sp.]